MNYRRGVLVVAGGGLLAAALCFGASPMSVQVKTGQLRAQASFLGQVTGTLNYGARVDVIQQTGEWMQVRTADGKTGWMHQSALSKKKIVMAAGQRDTQTGASGDELALAGKGFNSDVEADFKAKNKNVDFTWVDWMEKIKVTPEQSAEFLREGGVRAAQGGVR